ncbi:hypothetical protein VTN00DRAFT_4499 [Thermoascus crustaceus]|uniref:uncharacterized protein n=1 Tax=Thermoascus crustaceus TaxID=5088 RepID=UPI0037430804
MSNVFSIAWRIPCPGLRASSGPLLSTPGTFRALCSASRGGLCELPVRQPLNSSFAGRSSSQLGLGLSSFRCSPSKGPFPSVFFRSLKSKNSPPEQQPSAEQEHGVSVRSTPLSAAEITKIFGPGKVSTAMGNRVLSVLHGRRLAGTLDLDLPVDITRSVRKSSLDAALAWLREHHPIDEDAAILARIEREEREEEEKLIRRAEELGLYKPQSGHYGAELGEASDIYGRSVLKEHREQNEARLLAEQEQKRKEWLEGEAKDREKIEKMAKQLKRNTELQKFEENAVVEARPRADPQERPLLAWIQKHHLRATNNDIDTSNMTTARRILPALGVTLLTLAGCYIFAQTYQTPAQKDRMWPDIPPAAATVMGIMGVNLAVFALWKAWPPAWKMLNRYFISVPIYPHAFSIVGSVFSHQQFRHLATNMVILWFIGTRLHDEIGRANFLPLFLASGVIGSLTSLTAHVLAGKLTVTSLGASGAIAGLVAAWCTIHANDKLTLFFLPREWQETFSARGSTFLGLIVAFETLSLVAPFLPFQLFLLSRVPSLDHWAHLGGYLSGAAWAAMFKAKKEHRDRKRNEELGLLGMFFEK